MWVNAEHRFGNCKILEINYVGSETLFGLQSNLPLKNKGIWYSKIKVGKF